MTEYSVLMAFYSGDNPKFLKESIESLLKQTHSPYEIVLVQDGPITKELDEVINSYKNYIKLVKLESNVGLGIALRNGLEVCKCEYIFR